MYIGDYTLSWILPQQDHKIEGRRSSHQGWEEELPRSYDTKLKELTIKIVPNQPRSHESSNTSHKAITLHNM